MNYREVGPLKKMINGWQRHEQQGLLCRKIWKQTALSFVLNSSHTKWKGWKSDLKRYKFDAELIDAQLMKTHDSRISEADGKNLITYWRSSVFESRSAIAKKNHASASYIQQQESRLCY